MIITPEPTTRPGKPGRRRLRGTDLEALFKAAGGVRAVAKLIKVGRTTVYRWMKKGEVPFAYKHVVNQACHLLKIQPIFKKGTILPRGTNPSYGAKLALNGSAKQKNSRRHANGRRR